LSFCCERIRKQGYFTIMKIFVCIKNRGIFINILLDVVVQVNINIFRVVNNLAHIELSYMPRNNLFRSLFPSASL
jgi:hypothetical protein